MFLDDSEMSEAAKSPLLIIKKLRVKTDESPKSTPATPNTPRGRRAAQKSSKLALLVLEEDQVDKTTKSHCKFWSTMSDFSKLIFS